MRKSFNLSGRRLEQKVLLIAVREMAMEAFSMIGKTISHYRIIEQLGWHQRQSAMQDRSLFRQ